MQSNTGQIGLEIDSEIGASQVEFCAILFLWNSSECLAFYHDITDHFPIKSSASWKISTFSLLVLLSTDIMNKYCTIQKNQENEMNLKKEKHIRLFTGPNQLWLL